MQVTLCTAPGAAVAAEAWSLQVGPYAPPDIVSSVAVAVSDGSGGIVTVWVDGRALSDGNLFASRVDASGILQWKEGGIELCTAVGSQSGPAAISDGAGGAIVAWVDGRDDANNTDVYVQRVGVNGVVQWATGGVPLCRATGAQKSLVLAPDGAGGAIVAWEDGRSGNNTPDLYAQRVGATGVVQWALNGVPITRAVGSQNSVAIASDGSGGAIVAWRVGTGSPEIWVQRLDPDGDPLWLSGGIALATWSSSSSYPAVISDGAGGAIIAWFGVSPSSTGLIWAQRVDATGSVQWVDKGVSMDGGLGNNGVPAIVSDAAGGAVVAWADGVRRSVYAQRVNGAGGTQWPVGGVALLGYRTYLRTRLVADGAGGAFAGSEYPYAGSTKSSYVQHVNAAGALQWGSGGIMIPQSNAWVDEPALVPDGQGGLLVNWIDHTFISNPQFPPGSPSGAVNLWANRLSAAGAYQWLAYGTLVTTGAAAQSSQLAPRVAPDGAGGTIVAWWDSRTGGDLFAQHLGADGMRYWAFEGIALTTASGNKTGPQLTTDGAGGAIVTWQAGAASTDVGAQRVDATGNLAWGAAGVVVSAAAGNQYAAQVVPDGSSGAIVAWEDDRSGGKDVYVQRVDAAGTASWTPDGVLLTGAGDQRNPQLIADDAGGAVVVWESTADGSLGAARVSESGAIAWSIASLSSANALQSDPRIASDGAGGAIVVWVDERNGNADLYAQHASATGTLAWEPAGVAVCTASAAQSQPDIAAYGSGGIIAVWSDGRADAGDVYAQQLDGEGTPRWGTDGTPLCVVTGAQSHPRITNDGFAGAVVAWEDGRSGAADIYAQRVSPCGTTMWTTNGRAIVTAVNAQTDPRPIVDGTGGAIVAWQDPRSVTSLIWANRSLLVNAGYALTPTAGDHGSICPSEPLGVESGGSRTFMIAPDADHVITDVLVDGVSVGNVTSYTFTNVTANHTIAALFGGPLDVGGHPPTPLSFALVGPSPSVGGATFRLGIPSDQPVRLSVYDLSGRRIVDLVNGELPAGEHSVSWRAREGASRGRAGVYFVEMMAAGRRLGRRVVLLE